MNRNTSDWTTSVFKERINLSLKLWLLFVFAGFVIGKAQANERTVLVNLSGPWRFSIGDNMEWQKR